MASSLSMSLGIGIAIVGFVGGYLITISGYCALFATVAALTVVGAMIFRFYFRKPRGEFIRQHDAVPAISAITEETA